MKIYTYVGTQYKERMCPEEVTSSYLCEERSNHHLSLQRIHQNVSSSDIEEKECEDAHS